jgi:hypothetical protein
MKRRFLIGALIPAALFLCLVLADSSAGQLLESDWSNPYRLSSQDASAGQPYILSDQYGLIHTFWIETSTEDERATIFYSNFNGTTWASPIDIYASQPGSPILYASIDVDDTGFLHLAWTEGENGPVYYTTAPAYNALSARYWQQPARLDLSSPLFELQIDGAGVFHLIYVQPASKGSGLYYKRSEDKGITWQNQRRLDPDTPSNFSANVIKFVVHEKDTLHATWTYIDLNIAVGAAGSWVRYAHSLDGGLSWAFPVSIDIADESPDELRMAFPAMTVSGDVVNIVWTGDSAVHREYSYSTDLGETWNTSRHIFGDLQGQARGDGLAVDSLGRTHFIGNIRWPTGLYYSVWDSTQWMSPVLVYLIRTNSEEDVGDRISAHDIRLAIRAGNQLVTVFGDAPGEANRGLFTMNHTLADAPLLTVDPLPTATPEPTPVPSATPQPIPVAQPTVASQLESQSVVLDTPTPGRSLALGVVPIMLLLGVFFFARLVVKRR